MPPPIGPNKNRSRYLAVLVLIVAVFPMVMTGLVLTTVRPDEYWIAAVPAAPALLLVAWASRLWRQWPAAGAGMVFHDSGFRLFRPRGRDQSEEVNIHWADLREIAFRSGGYGVRILDFLLTHDAAVRLGLVRDTTRPDASDMLVKRAVSVSPNSMELSGEDIVARMAEAARQAGFRLTRTSSRFLLVVAVTKWRVETGDPEGI